MPSQVLLVLSYLDSRASEPRKPDPEAPLYPEASDPRTFLDPKTIIDPEALLDPKRLGLGAWIP